MAMRRASATVPAPERLLTVAEFIQMPESNEGYELIKGRLVKKPVPRWKHSDISFLIIQAYILFDPQQKLGRLRGEVGVELRDDYSPQPDLGWWRTERVPDFDAPIAPIPDLAIEIHSHGQTIGDLTGKANDYIAGGVPLVWVIYPDNQVAHIFRQGVVGHEIVGIEGELSGENIIPDFKIAMRALFQNKK